MRWLEAESQLEFDHATGQAIRWSAELTGVDDVGRRGGWRKRLKIQDVKRIEEITAELQLGILAQRAGAGEIEIFPKGQVELGESRPFKNIAATAARPMRCRWDCSGTREAGRDVGEDSILPVLFRWICDFATSVNDRHVRARSVAVQIVIRITAANQSGEGKTGMLSEDTSESPTTGDGTHKVMPATINWQLIVSGYAQVLAYIEVGVAFVDGLREWVGLLKTDLVRREVNAVAPGVEGRNGEAVRKNMRKLSDHGVEAGVYVRKRYEDPAKAIVADDDGSGTGRVRRATRDAVRAGALHAVHIAVECVTGSEAILVDRASELTTAATLIADSGLPIVDRLKLRLE